MSTLYYTPLDIAAIIHSQSLSGQEEAKLLEQLQQEEQAFLQAEYRHDKRRFLLSVFYWQQYLNSKPSIDAEFPAIRRDLQALGSQMDIAQFTEDEIDLALFFKSVRIRILFLGSRDYARIKLRTLMKAYGYKRRSAKLLTQLRESMWFFHMTMNLHGIPCDPAEIGIDEMVTFRLME